MTCIFRCQTLMLLLVGLIAMIAIGASPAAADESPLGLAPAGNMTYMPHLPGLRNKTFRNHMGKSKKLSEAVVLRQSTIKEGEAHVPPGGLFYISETSGDAQPLLREPFLVLGEHAHLVDLVYAKHVVRDVAVNLGEKAPVADTGYRMWYDYVTDHYGKPYAELALISPSGGWPLEFPIASVFSDREEVTRLQLGEGHVGQIAEFYLDKEYFYGAMKMVARNLDFKTAEFESVEFPAITEAVFSMHRPIILGIRQEDYRFYFNKRIYAFRQPDGFLVRVTNFSGTTVLAEKLVKPITGQGYKSLASEKDKYHLTIPELDMRIEIMLHPRMMSNSDFLPWSTGKSHGFQEGELHFVVYRQLMTVKDGQTWPLDARYTVRLEPNMKTGMLQRLVIENAQALTFSNETPSHSGPVKWSDVWNRPAFKVVAKNFDDDVVKNLYLRDYYLMRTDNMIFWPDEGRENIDFFVGSTPVLEPILEDTFLKRLSDSEFGTVVEGSHFTSYPKAVSDSSFFEPDHTAPYVPRLKGLKRKLVRNRKNERLIAAESIFIRGSYVDYRNNRIIIPPAGLNYSSRNARNLRTLAGESFFLLGKEAYLTSFKSSTFVQKNVHLDLWKNQPMGDGNLMYWQDQLLGIRNKTLRFTGLRYLDDRPVAELSLMKYSGNRWAAHFLLAQGFDPSGENRYHMPEVFAEGATYIIPEYIGSNYVKIKEFGTPSIEEIGYTYEKPKAKSLGVGETVKVGEYILECMGFDAEAMTVDLVFRKGNGEVIAEKTIGPLNDEMRNLLPQYQDAARAMQFSHADVMAEWDIDNPFDGDKVALHVFSGIQLLQRDTPFEFDNRFMVRPDVCGHCYQVNEVLLDNPEPIILDKNNRVFEGPRREDGTPLFRIVIDHFDGEKILAWHIEIEDEGKVEKTDNLAFRPRNNVDVLVGVTGTNEGFLRLSMLPRLGFMEYWRTSGKGPETRLSGSVNTGGSAHIKR